MDKVNILISMLCRTFHEEVIDRLREKLDIGYSVAVTEMYKGNVSEFNETFEMGDCFRGLYYKYGKYGQTRPVDDDIIKLMQPYDMEVLKMMDRHQGWKWDFEQRMQVYYEHIRFWNFILDKYKINHSVFLNVPHEAFDYVIYCLCKIKGIKTLVLNGCPIFAERALLYSKFEDLDNIFGVGRLGLSQSTPSYSPLEKYEAFVDGAKIRGKKNRRPWAGASRKELEKYMSFMDLRKFIEEDDKCVKGLRNLAKNHPHFAGMIARFRYIPNTIKSKKLHLYYERLADRPAVNEKYILYALHYQPEATSSPMGGGIYSNQIIPIKILSHCLPQGYKLYVKEHPVQSHVGRKAEFYNRLKRIPNVKLISKKEDSYDLLKKSKAVASLTGTIIVEGVVNGIPAISFGLSEYNYMEGVYHVRTVSECRKVVLDIINDRVDIDQEKVKAYFKKLYGYSLPINVGYGDYDEHKNAKLLSTALCRAIMEG